MLMSSPHEATSEQEEIWLLKELIGACVKLATHIRPDLDAIFSVLMCQRLRKTLDLDPVEVLFIPANTKGIEQGIFAVDVGRGKGVVPYGEGYAIKQSAVGGSATLAIFRCLPPLEQSILGPLAHAISYADEKGENVHSVSLKRYSNNSDTRSQVVNSNDWYTHRVLAHVLNDRQLLHWWEAKFDGMIEDGLKQMAGAKAAAEADFRLDGQLAILPYGAPSSASAYAYQKGAKVVLFSAPLGGDRWTLGLVRNPTPVGGPIDLNVLRPILTELFPDIYIHPVGFMAGWTAKGPLIRSQRQYEKMREHFIGVVTEGLRATLGDDEGAEPLKED